MPVAQQPPDDVAAHPTETDHAELHRVTPRRRGRGRRPVGDEARHMSSVAIPLSRVGEGLGVRVLRFRVEFGPSRQQLDVRCRTQNRSTLTPDPSPNRERGDRVGGAN
ncbi:hypothetical protein mvi_32850 [Methylobacterium indicum]|uniref:Uncharacterized protein n=1 Tax=Methylobacterium indicum TaxID=1775910 RepID=A0A8H8WUX6_9HYPH|nr:hypothetical protein mvi_32850 [Methylobacterium indicum]